MFCSLTLSPALASQILLPHEEKQPPAAWNFIARGWEWFTRLFNRGFDWLSHFYADVAGFVIRYRVVMLLVYVVLIGSAGWLLVTTPQGYIPGTGSRLRDHIRATARRGLAGADHRDRSQDREHRARYARNFAYRGLCRSVGSDPHTGEQLGGAVSGVRRTGSAPQEGAERAGDHGGSAQAAVSHRRRLHHRDPTAADPGHRHRRRFHHAHPGPPGPRSELLAAATDELVAAARKSPLLLAPTVFSPFSANTPQVFVDIDQVKAQKLGVPIQNITDTIQTYFGSTYVNDFNLFGRTYHVTAQADLPFRKERPDLARLRTRNADGDMVMLGSVVDFKDVSGPDRVARYNLYPAAELQGEASPGMSSATAITAMKKLAEREAAERLFL